MLHIPQFIVINMEWTLASSYCEAKWLLKSASASLKIERVKPECTYTFNGHFHRFYDCIFKCYSSVTVLYKGLPWN